jgi:HD-GYP domain-containing protein (c-di-GMP phosphodiesterase class II)/DNA-binding response OmpR family regulator
MASSYRDEISRLELLHAAHPDGLVFPHLADAYRRAGRYSQAEGLLAAGLSRHGNYSSAHVVLGRLRLDQGKREEARRAFRQVLHLDPQNQVALEYLGELAVEEGRIAEALQHFRALQRLKPDGAVSDRIEELTRRLPPQAPNISPPEAGHQPGAGFTNGGDGGDGARVATASVGPVGSAGSADGEDSARPVPPSTSGPGAPAPPAPVEPASPSPVEPEEVVTETMAELYVKQGLYPYAAAVYRELMARNPGDDRLAAKLAAVRARAEESSAGTEEPASAAPGQPAGGEDGAGTAPAGAVVASSDPTPGVRSYLRELLEWSPEPVVPEPWEEAAVSSAPAVTAVEAEPPGGVEEQWSPSLAEASEQAGDATQALIGITDLLVGLLEYRDPFFRGSSSLTRLLASSVAEEMGLSAVDRVNLALAAVLRDLGRLALGGRLLPTGRIGPSDDARRRIERHVDLALHLLEGIALPAAVRAAVRHHHERWDGAGYPDALAGETIPLLARILAVVDSFTAMVSPRSYRVPRKVPDAARELEEEAGTRYDPAVVDALVRVVAKRDRPNLGFVQRHHILLVDPDQPGAVVTAAKLCSVGYLAEVAVDPAVARERLRRVPVAALVVSAEAVGDGVPRFIEGLRADPHLATLPIIAVAAEGVAWRVRLLECGADICFPPGVSHNELQATLGALLRRTRQRAAEPGSGEAPAESPWLALQGDVQDFPLTWLLQVMKYDSRTAAIAIRTSEFEGVIYLRQGDAVHAQVRGGTKGEPALRQMLRWRKGRFTVQPDARPREETIRTSIMHLLLTQAVDEDHAAAGIFGAVSAEG